MKDGLRVVLVSTINRLSSHKLVKSPLKVHLVRPLVTPQAEARSKVSLQIRSLSDISQNHLVHFLLVLDPLRVYLFLLRRLAILEKVILALTLLLLTSPVLVLADTIEDLGVYAVDVDDR